MSDFRKRKKKKWNLKIKGITVIGLDRTMATKDELFGSNKPQQKDTDEFLDSV